MKKLISSGRERDWFLVKEWTTKAGLKARVQQCVWKLTDLLPSHCTGYVLKDPADKRSYYNSDVDVHGGVTFEGEVKGVVGTWVGFDMAHLGDEGIKDQLEYCVGECEKLAEQMKNHG